MAGLLTSAVTDEQRIANDIHRPWAVVAVLGVVAIYIYLFTHAHVVLGLPAPQDLADYFGIDINHVFGADRNVNSRVTVNFTQRYDSNDDERLVLFLAIAGAFLSAYFLPLRYKQTSLVMWTTVGICLLFGVPTASVLIAAHMVVYLTLHPRQQEALMWGAVPGGLVVIGLSAGEVEPPPVVVIWPLASALLYRYLWLPLLSRPRLAPLMRSLVVQSALLTVLVAALAEGVSGDEWKLPLGVLYFFWQWERLIMYHIDYKDGLVPEDIPVWRYLAVFLSPAAIPNFHMRVAIGQGYAYINNAFLCEDKNKIVFGGIRILLVALAYLLFVDWGRYFLIDVFEGLGIPVYQARIKYMIQHFHQGGEVSTISVLMTSMVDLARWILIYASVAHFKVGVWRICGYKVDPSFNKPWMATNLVSFWARFTFHYREFLVRAFYYPVFFRFFRKHPMTRVVLATIAAVTIGNLIWGHLAADLFYQGLEFRRFGISMATLPYFVLLGLGIALTEVYLLKRKRTRRPWTPGPRMIMDVLAVYCTLQFYALIHIFIELRGGASSWEVFRLFLMGFGLKLPA
jgi:hypothetical protein